MILPTLKAPVVLVHGIMGFGRLRLGTWILAEYFRGLPQALENAGNRVLIASLNPTAAVADRAAELKRLVLRESPSEPVHILAHSMGGLDSRYMISRLDMADRVLSLTTLGTPHRGTAFADWGLKRLGSALRMLLNYVALPIHGFRDLTTASCREFNAAVPNAANVRYFSVAGRFASSWMRPEWQMSAPLLDRTEGPNDGIVSVASAKWGESVEEWEGDHMSLVNWPNVFAPAGPGTDRLPQYAGLVRRLADEGF